ncbi:MAG: extracytoplasmic sigma factor ECF [Phycisphaerae bacterium]|nr:MAG: extracytoplasmic sigma factor ECF [Phycisphaerae bacterium]
MASDRNATEILDRLSGGDPSAADELLPLVHDELRAIAAVRMRGQNPGHTLQPTALVNEAIVQLLGSKNASWQSRAHFMAVAATAMRQILIKHARRGNAEKRGGGWQRVTLSQAVSPGKNQDWDIESLNEALVKLATLSPRQCRIVELRFFGGLTIKETACALGVSTTTVADDWTAARAWLSIQLANHD